MKHFILRGLLAALCLLAVNAPALAADSEVMLPSDSVYAYYDANGSGAVDTGDVLCIGTEGFYLWDTPDMSTNDPNATIRILAKKKVNPYTYLQDDGAPRFLASSFDGVMNHTRAYKNKLNALYGCEMSDYSYLSPEKVMNLGTSNSWIYDFDWLDAYYHNTYQQYYVVIVNASQKSAYEVWYGSAYIRPLLKIPVSRIQQAEDGMHTATIAEMVNGTITLTSVGNQITINPVPEVGYVLSAAGVTDEAGNPIAVADNTFTMPAKNIRITASFERKDYSVTFDSQNGQQMTTRTVKANDTLAEPDSPVREGYIFKGWYTDAECTSGWSFGADRVTSDMTLYAGWQEIVASVTANGTAEYFADFAQAMGAACNKGTATITLLKDVSLTYADAYNSRIILDLNGKTITFNICFSIENASLTIVDSGESGGIVFGNGFRIYPDYGSSGSVTKLTLMGGTYTNLSIESWSFDPQGDTGTTLASILGENCAYYERGGVVSDDAILNGSAYSGTLRVAPIRHTVTFCTDGGSTLASREVNHAALLARPENPVRDGYDFAGWYKDADCTEEWSFASDPVMQDVTLYAKWTQRPAPVYLITDGADQTIHPGDCPVFRSTAEFSDFAGVRVDGVALTRGRDYKAEAGSTVVTLLSGFTKQLSPGEHTLDVLSVDGTASTTFTIVQAVQLPKTGDSSNLTLYVALLLLSSAGVVCLRQRKKEGSR